jgi:rhamnosyltransferase
VTAIDVSVVVLAKNARQTIEPSMRAILATRSERRFEVIVIDSGSSDGTREYVQRLAAQDQRVRLVDIPSESFHHSRTRNLGATLASGRYLVFLNGDAVAIGPTWLDDLVEPVANGLVTAAYARQAPRTSADVLSICRMSFNYGPAPLIKDMASHLSARQRYLFSTVACAIDLDRVERPLFDDRYPVAEDVVLAKRIIDDGGSIAYLPGVVVDHHHRYGYLEILRRYFDYAVTYERSGIFANDRGIGGDGRRYLASSARILRNRPFIDTLRFAAFFLASGIGVLLGRAHRFLPRLVCDRLTVYGTCDLR